MKLHRRTLFQMFGTAAFVGRVRPSTADSPASDIVAPAGGLRLWSDPRFHTMPGRGWRKIHLDFHNSEHVPVIGAEFNEDEWGDQLVAANVDSIVIFAKDMHGYCY